MIRNENVEIENGKIKVTVNLREYCNRDNRRVVTCKTKDVEQALTEMGINFGKCLESSNLSNKHPQYCSGTWTFEQKRKKTSSKRKSYSKSNKESLEKSEKTLDKSAEDVIIIENETLESLLTPEE
jgi:hypothetical protein